MSANRITRILNDQQAISMDTAPRQPRYFGGTTPQLWMKLQETWERSQAEFPAGRTRPGSG